VRNQQTSLLEGFCEITNRYSSKLPKSPKQGKSEKLSQPRGASGETKPKYNMVSWNRKKNMR
jgi:hypothetical protein